jgi:PTS system nitrogen regulatory IIA component
VDSTAPNFGATLRLLRTEASLSLRELAERIGVSGAYLSRVENGHDAAPTPDRLIAIAKVLEIPAPVLLELAQQTGPAVSGYLERVPAANALFLEIARRDLNAAQIARLRAFMDTEFSNASPAAHRGPRLSELLSKERVILGLKCTEIDDLIDVAVTRLPRFGVAPAELAQRMKAHEHESPSVIGNGLIAPHAVVEGATPAAALVSIGSRLRVASSDGPIRVAVVLVSSGAGRPHLETLARIARLARYQIADQLRSAKTPAQALALIERIESLW